MRISDWSSDVCSSDLKGDRVKASPLAKRLAEASGIDLNKVQGSGPGGRVVKADLEGAAASPAAVDKAASDSAGPAPAPAEAAAGEIPHEVTHITRMRKGLIRRITHSKKKVRH